MQTLIKRNATLLLIINYSLLITLTSCSVTRQISKQAQQYVISDSNLATAHIGISLYDATNNKYLYNYQGDKYFIPASNTKIFTCYAAMKYLGDSLPGIKYRETQSGITIQPTADPTLLHPDFTYQPVYDFLNAHKQQSITVFMPYGLWEEDAWGVGWSWDDYNDDYMAERSPLPIYGNTANFVFDKDVTVDKDGNIHLLPAMTKATPAYFQDSIVDRMNTSSKTPAPMHLQRGLANNIFIATGNYNTSFKRDIPFVTNGAETFARLLADTLHSTKVQFEQSSSPIFNLQEGGDARVFDNIIHSQPTDSLLKIMMHRSDNFYAEQSLLMVSNQHLGVMSDEKIIDTLLKTDLKGLPQHPQWVDGSGLSRFNLFTPQDFVYILNRMKNEYAWNRITTIFETGGSGTLNGYYKSLAGKIYAKTGSLSNDIALSGYLITQKNKTIIFSVQVNNHKVSASAVRRAVERFLTQVQQEE